jgi:hypothetical protein
MNALQYNGLWSQVREEEEATAGEMRQRNDWWMKRDDVAMC